MAISSFRFAGLLVALSAGCAGKSAPTRPLESLLLLATADGATVNLVELARGQDATVLVFWSAGCPCVRRYQERVDALLDRYPRERVCVLGVSSNAGEPFADVLATARERGVRIPIARDEGGRVASALGARSTPTIVLLDRRGETRFVGWFDNERLPGKAGREAWLDRALAGVLAGHNRFASRTPVHGCAITRSLFSPPRPSCCDSKETLEKP
jgi:hypothetical protein